MFLQISTHFTATPEIPLSGTIEENSFFSNSSHLEWRAELSDTILKWTHPGTIPARLRLIWFSGFRGEDIKVKVYDVRRMPSDGKSSHDLWPGELKNDGKVFLWINTIRLYQELF